MDYKAEDFMTSKEAFKRKLFSIAIPVALQNLMVALIGASDALMLGRLNQDAVSAVSLANQISFIMSLFTGAVMIGAGSLIAQYYGKKDMITVKKLMSVLVKLCFTISFVFFALTFFFPNILMRIYTPQKELIEIGSKYLRIVSWSYLFVGLSQSYLMVMKICGRAAKSAWITTLAVVVDMVADLFLIYGIAGAPRLEVAGCAVSTVMTEACVLAVCILDSYQKDHIHLEQKVFWQKAGILMKDLGRVALPALASGLAWGVGFSMHSMIIGRLGGDAIAAAAVVSVIHQLVTCFCRGLSNGASIMTGALLGQNRLEKAQKCGASFCKIAFFCGIFNAVLVLILGPIASRFFILTDDARMYLVQMLVVLVVYLFSLSFNSIVVNGIFSAGGDTMYDAISVLLSMWAFSIPLGILGVYLHWPVIVIYIVVMADEIVKIPWIYPRYKRYLWLKNLTRETQ